MRAVGVAVHADGVQPHRTRRAYCRVVIGREEYRRLGNR
jgi:hypothetical protein